MSERSEQETTEAELCRRVTLHLKHRGSGDAAVLLWSGFIAGLLEWGVIKIDSYDRLIELFPEIGRDELAEIFLGLPDQN